MSLQALIGERIRELREAKKLTQEELAAMARSDAATLSRIETGKQNLTAETLALYLIALNVTPQEFFASDAFGESLTPNSDDPDSINSERFVFRRGWRRQPGTLSQRQASSVRGLSRPRAEESRRRGSDPAPGTAAG